MRQSLLLQGVLAENAEAVRAQVWAFDHATVIHEFGRRVPRLLALASERLPFVEPLERFMPSGFSERVPDDPIRHAREDNLILPITSMNWRAAKLGRLLRHFELRLTSYPSESELLDLCNETEARAVALLTRLDGPGRGKKGQTPFEGTSVIDLAQHVLRRIFTELARLIHEGLV